MAKEEKKEQENSNIKELFEQGLAFGSELIFETDKELKIQEKYGNDEATFENARNPFPKGTNLLSNLLKIVNFPQLVLTDTTVDGIGQIEGHVLKFLDSKISETVFRFLGEKSNGEMYLLSWKLIRRNPNICSFIKITPSNSIVNAIKLSHSKELANTTNVIQTTFDTLSEGVIVLDIRQAIKFINVNAKPIFFSAGSNFALKAKFEDKMLSDLITHDNEALIAITNLIKETIATNAPTMGNAIIKNNKYAVKVSTLYNVRNKFDGIILTFSSNMEASNDCKDSLAQNKYYQVQHKNLLKIIKQLADEKNLLDNRINELETNQSYLMRQSSSANKQLRLFQLYLDNVPVPISISNFPDLDIEYGNIAFCGISKLDKKVIKGMKDEEVFDEKNLLILKQVIAEHMEKKGFFNIETETLHVKQLILRDSSLEPMKLLRIFHKFPDK